MKFQIICIGKTRQQYLLDGEAEYQKRLKPHCQLSLVELPAASKQSVSERVMAEGQQQLSKVKPNELLIALDEKGKDLTSEQFSYFLQDKALNGCGSVAFVLGGPYGLSPAVKKRADLTMKMSSMTFTSQMARFVLVEQLYRAMMIWKGVPYHKV